ncbi:hypothetical protein HJ590_17125 [Naumannella sp. ID2617S]|nr:hypothetical protein [Naumannella sp. ID2617S]
MNRPTAEPVEARQRLGLAARLLGAAGALAAGVLTAPVTGMCEQFGPCGVPTSLTVLAWGERLLVVGLVLLAAGFLVWVGYAATQAGEPIPARLPLPVQLLLLIVLVDLILMVPLGAALIAGRHLVVGLACWWLLGLVWLLARPLRARGLPEREVRAFALVLGLAAVGSAAAVAWAAGLGLTDIRVTEDAHVPWAWPALLIGHLGVPLLVGLLAAQRTRGQLTSHHG